MNVIDLYKQISNNDEKKDWYDDRKVQEILFLYDKNHPDYNEFDLINDHVTFSKFISILEPSSNLENDKKILNNHLFIALCFYFKYKGIRIEELPQLLETPLNQGNIDNSLYQTIVYIRDISLKGDSNYARRREFNNSLTFTYINQNLYSEKIFSFMEVKGLLISGISKFSFATKKDKLFILVKTVENLLKDNKGNWVKIDDHYFLDLLDEEKIKKYRTGLWFIRHGHDKAIELMEKLNELDLDFLINIGIVICARLYDLKNKIH